MPSRIRVCRLLLILLALIVAGRPVTFAQASQSAQRGLISGAVVEKASGRAVPGAVVTVEGPGLSATTNAAGRFLLEGIASPQATLVVRAPGFLELRVSGVATGSLLTIELDPTPNFMERVQVTATKSALSIGEVAAGTDVVNRSTLESRGVQTLPQAIAHIPGAYVSTELGIFDSVMLRGMPRGDPEFTNTLLLIDGVPQTLSNNGARVRGHVVDADAAEPPVARPTCRENPA